MSKLITIGDNLYFTPVDLIDLWVSNNTIKKWKVRNPASFISIENSLYIPYEFIPIKTREKLPTKQELITKADLQAKALKIEEQQNANNLKELQIQAAFEKAADKYYIKYNPLYFKHFPNDSKKVAAYAIEHAVAVACVAMNTSRPKVKANEIHAVYKQLPYNWIITDYTRFSAKLKNWKAGNINLFHARYGKPCIHNTKLTDYLKGKVEQYYKHPNQYGFEMITALVNKDGRTNGEKEIGIGCVKKYIAQPGNKNRLSFYRNPEYFNRTVQPTVRRKSIQYAGDLYYGDGSPLQIRCWNASHTAIIRLNLFVIMDVMSGKIVGFDLSETEDRYNWFAALKMAFNIEKIAPFEFKYDNASATKTEEFQALKQAMELKGCLFNATKKGNPKEKSPIERWFETFQSRYQRMIDGFIGEGIRSKRDNGRISADFLTRLHKSDGYYSYESMLVIIANLISFYNQSKRSHKAAPSELYKNCVKQNANKLSIEDIAFLFWKFKTIKVTKGEIKTEIRKNDYFYQVFDHETALKINGKQVKMYYDETDLSVVHLFSLEGHYIAECRQKVLIHEGKAGQTETDILTLIKQSKHNESIKTVIKKQTVAVTEKAALSNDEFSLMLNPYQVAKEEFNNAETSSLLNEIIKEKNIDLSTAKEYEPAYTEPQPGTSKLQKNWSSKYQDKNPGLEIVKESE